MLNSKNILKLLICVAKLPSRKGVPIDTVTAMYTRALAKSYFLTDGRKFPETKF